MIYLSGFFVLKIIIKRILKRNDASNISLREKNFNESSFHESRYKLLEIEEKFLEIIVGGGRDEERIASIAITLADASRIVESLPSPMSNVLDTQG